MQPADHRDGDDLPFVGGLTRAQLRSVLVEREVGSGAVVVLEVSLQDASQVLLSEDDDVVQALAPNGADQALTRWIVPRRARRGQDLLDSHRTHATNEGRAIDLVSVSDQRVRRRVLGEGVGQLLPCPLR